MVQCGAIQCSGVFSTAKPCTTLKCNALNTTAPNTIVLKAAALNYPVLKYNIIYQYYFLNILIFCDLNVQKYSINFNNEYFIWLGHSTLSSTGVQFIYPY